MTTSRRWGSDAWGSAAIRSREARLATFVDGEESEALLLFSPDERVHSLAGEWYGEHVGKWLVASASAVEHGADELRGPMERTVERLAEWQEADGYLGTYAPAGRSRFDHPEAGSSRTWDLWVHAWLVLGLLEVERVTGNDLAGQLALRVGELLVSVFGDGSRSVVDQGNHAGLSSAVAIQPLARLGVRFGDARFFDLAERVIADLEARGISVVSGVQKGLDVSELGTGKVYQLLWVFLGMVELGRATGREELVSAVSYWWDGVRAGHLNPLGGPWGGMAGHKEVFNAKGFFDPGGMVETCSTATWLELCRWFFELRGEERFLAEFERSWMNALLGAADANGADWCYFTFANGRRNNTYHWACCKSSGAMALERGLDLAQVWDQSGVSLNLYLNGSSAGMIEGVTVRAEVCWRWEGTALTGEVVLSAEEAVEVEVRLRRPEWAVSAGFEGGAETVRRLQVDGEAMVTARVETDLSVTPFTYTIDHHGQEIVREDYAFATVGPLILACGRIDGYREAETLRLARLTPTANFHLGEAGEFGPSYDLRFPGRGPIRFLPFVEAGGRHEHGWRTTWLQVAWQ